ncbi:MAG: hypothetical protein L0387_23325 [Acidobacteria bacterium]|nr:hypothetical protein [Acidobacteriota bacterium]MCI0624541.1 hypothetical protein [Acidobacteriota bacterium]MCI0721006.1 hypothetical protein [Acidobacteriota bacterium]
MPKIIWTVQPVSDGYQGFVRVTSAVLNEASGAWFSVKETPFVSEVAAQMAAQDAAYRLGVKLAAKEPNSLPSDIIIERA